jgi:hypothetical protein
MRLLLLFPAYVLICSQGFTQASGPEKIQDTTAIRVSGRIVLGNAGFAPVPAFSFNSPIAIGLLSIRKKQFSYEPDLSIGLNGKPWMASNWFRFSFLERKKIKLSTGINPSLFFQTDRIASGEEIINTLRNMTFEFVAELKFSDGWSSRMTYMHIHAFDNGGLSGDFIDASSSVSVIRIPEMIAIHLKPQLFYFNFSGKVDGLFTSAILSIDLKKIPLSLFGQGVLMLWSNFPVKNFQWNAGAVYAF